MNFVEIARIGRASAAIIDSAAQRKLNICKRGYVKHRRTMRQEGRSMQDNWQRLAFGLSWESRFYRQGLKEGYGIMTLFDEMFDILGEDKGQDWYEVVEMGVLRPLSFTEEPNQELRTIPYEREEWTHGYDMEGHDVIERLLLEEVHRGVCLAYWTDSQITDKADYPAEAVAKWDQIISQAKEFYNYSQICHWRQEAKVSQEELTMKVPGGVFALHPSDIPYGLVVETLNEN